MRTRTTKRPYVLLDANVIIQTHELGSWRVLTRRLDLLVPSAIVGEAKYFTGQDGWPTEIDLPRQVSFGIIREVSASFEELAVLASLFDRSFLKRMHPGEDEALALMRAGKASGASFCTSDASAIQALAMLGLSERGLSLERVFGLVGRSLPSRTPERFGEAFFQHNLGIGRTNRITGLGLGGSSIERPS